MARQKADIQTVYAEDDNMTFIMEYYYEDDKVTDIEVAGFYFGEPDELKTKEHFICPENKRK